MELQRLSVETDQIPVTRPPSDRGQGRKPLPPAQRLIVKSIRLTADDWAKLARLGGVEWLREKIRKAKERA